ncbi:MAG: aldo/keto reductase, partial [Gemmatimonadaceae bacterium]
WLSGKWRKGVTPTDSHRASRTPEKFDLSRVENQRVLEVVEQLATLADDAGISLVHMALAFVLRHPAVTSAIIGPRTMEQLESQLGASDVTLDAALLDKIDAIVPPGTLVVPSDAGWQNPALKPEMRRR